MRIDHDDPHALVHGVLAADRSAGLIAYAQLTTAQHLAPRPVRIPELDADRRYVVRLVKQPGRGGSWLSRERMAVEDGIELTGRQLAAHGVRVPSSLPESLHLISVEAVSDRDPS